MDKDRHILKSVKAEVLKLNEPTKAGRVYTTECIKNALEDPILKERLEQHMFLGTLDTNDSNDILNTSHAVSELNIIDNSLVTHIDVLDTPNGRLLSNLMDNHIVAFSVRGQGKVEDNIVTDYELESVVASIRGDNND